MRSLILMTLLLLSLPSFAGESEPSKRDSLAGLLQLAYERNPSIQAARAGVEAMQARVNYVGTLPNPQLKATLFLVPIETRVGPQRLAVSATQNFPFFGTLSAREAVAARAAEVTQARLEAQARDVLTSVRLAWFEMHYLQRALEVVAQNQKLAGRIVEAGEASFGKGQIPYFDLNRAQAELARLSYDKVVLQDLLTSQWQSLNALLEREPPPLPEIPPLPALSLATDLHDLPELLLDNRPEIAAAAHNEEAAEAAVNLTRKAYWPDFGVGVTWLVHEAEGTAPDRGKDGLGITVGFDLPIWRTSLHAREDEARALQRQASSTVRSEVAKANELLAERVYDVVNAQRLLALYDGNLLPQAAAALDSAEALSADRGNFGTLLERQAIVFQYQLARERALADLYKATARLEQVVGTPLEYRTVPQAADSQVAGSAPSPDTDSGTVPLAADHGKPPATPRPKVKGEQDPGHIAHDEAWGQSSKLARKLGLRKALASHLDSALLARAVMARNPDIRRAEEAVLATTQRFSQVEYLDNLVGQYEDLSAEIAPAPRTSGPKARNRRSATGEGTLALKSAIAETELQESRVAAGLTRRKAVTEARLALADYRYAVHAHAVVKELRDLTHQLSELARQRVTAGSGKLTDVLQAEMLEAELATQLENLDDLAAQSRARIATLLDLPADFPLARPGERSSFDLPDLGKLLDRTKRRHELRLKDLEIERLEQVVALVQARAFPDLNTGQSELVRPLAKDGEKAFPARPMVKEDIYAAGRDAYLQELLARRDALQQDRRRLLQEIRNEVTQAHLSLRMALREVRLHRHDLAAKARQNLDLTLAAYRQGTASFTDLITAERDLIRHRIGTFDALRSAERATTRLQDASVSP